MYLYTATTTTAMFMYFVWRVCAKLAPYARRNVSFQLNKNDIEVEHTHLFYILNEHSYCLVAEGVRSLSDIDDNEVVSRRSVTHAELRKGGTITDVTELTRKVAGPRCNFHNEPIDFYWVFPYEEGVLFITFEDSSECAIELATNTLISGYATRIPLI